MAMHNLAKLVIILATTAA